MEVRGFLPKSVIAQDAQYGGAVGLGSRHCSRPGPSRSLVSRFRFGRPTRLGGRRSGLLALQPREMSPSSSTFRTSTASLVPEPVAIKGLVVELTETVTDGRLGGRRRPGLGLPVLQRLRQCGVQGAEGSTRLQDVGRRHDRRQPVLHAPLGRPGPGRQYPRTDLVGEHPRPRAKAARRAPPAEGSGGARTPSPVCRETCSYLVPLPDEQRLGWWGEEARINAEARAVAEAAKALTTRPRSSRREARTQRRRVSPRGPGNPSVTSRSLILPAARPTSCFTCSTYFAGCTRLSRNRTARNPRRCPI